VSWHGNGGGGHEPGGYDGNEDPGGPERHRGSDDRADLHGSGAPGVFHGAGGPMGFRGAGGPGDLRGAGDPEDFHDHERARPARRVLRGPLTVALAALVPAVLVGWLVFQANGSGADESGANGSGAAGGPGGTPAPASTDPSASASGRPGASADPSDGGARPGGSGAAHGPLAGKVVVIDPGHNPNNHLHTSEINQKVDVGNARKECDTTGTATNSGYPEARFTLDVARRLRTLLEEQGAKVVLTHDGKRPWGPCVDERARIGNEEHADAAISIHADGAPVGDRGFHVIVPAPVHEGGADTRAITGPSRDLGERIAGRFARVTGTSPSNYIGHGTGLDVRDDLGGLNLSKVPKVFIECGNMRDGKDAALITSGAWRQKAARGISEGMMSFLRG
jgi:N-acetylmuramoyl-L-alanine amidase